MMRQQKILQKLSLAVALMFIPTAAQAGDLCFQPPAAVPALVGPPAWMSGMGVVRTDLNEPRWSAPLTGFANDVVGQEGSFRIVKSADGTKLFVQVQTGQDHNVPGSNDQVYFGVSKDDTGANPLAFGFRFIIGSVIPASNPETAEAALNLRGYRYDDVQPAGSKWTSAAGKPAWITNPALWSKTPVVPVGDLVDWGVAFVVDLSALPTPITPTDTFKVAVGLNTNADAGGSTITKVYTPAPPGGFSSVPTNTHPFVETFPPNVWRQTVGTAPGCVSGIVLSSANISISNNVNPSTTTSIATNDGATNVFHAAPDFNSLSVANGGLTAEFRIANWGTVWAEAPWNPVQKSDGTTADKVGNVGTNFQFDCDANSGGTVCGINPVPPTAHQCVQVRLNYGPGYNFDTTPITVGSAYRNMNFQSLSKSESVAFIDTKGIDQGSGKTEIIMYVYQRNMPEHGRRAMRLNTHAMRKTHSEFFAPPKEGKKAAHPRESAAHLRALLAEQAKHVENLKRMEKLLQGKKPTKEELEAAAKVPTQVSPEHAMKEVWPHLEVHPYFQQGDRFKLDGVHHRHLVPMFPFDAYYDHKGAFYGFSQDFSVDGGKLEVLREPSGHEPGIFKLTIPKGKAAQLKIVTEAHEKPRKPRVMGPGGRKVPHEGEKAEKCVATRPLCTYVPGSGTPSGGALAIFGLLAAAGALLRRRRYQA